MDFKLSSYAQELLDPPRIGEVSGKLSPRTSEKVRLLTQISDFAQVARLPWLPSLTLLALLLAWLKCRFSIPFFRPVDIFRGRAFILLELRKDRARSFAA